MFNPMVDMPSTDEEARTALRFSKNENVGRALVGIFECRRALGDSLLLAYEKALLAYVGEQNKSEAN